MINLNVFSWLIRFTSFNKLTALVKYKATRRVQGHHRLVLTVWGRVFVVVATGLALLLWETVSGRGRDQLLWRDTQPFSFSFPACINIHSGVERDAIISTISTGWLIKAQQWLNDPKCLPLLCALDPSRPMAWISHSWSRFMSVKSAKAHRGHRDSVTRLPKYALDSQSGHLLH